MDIEIKWGRWVICRVLRKEGLGAGFVMVNLERCDEATGHEITAMPERSRK